MGIGSTPLFAMCNRSRVCLFGGTAGKTATDSVCVCNCFPVIQLPNPSSPGVMIPDKRPYYCTLALLFNVGLTFEQCTCWTSCLIDISLARLAWLATDCTACLACSSSRLACLARLLSCLGSALTTWAAKSSARIPFIRPFLTPIGLRTASMITLLLLMELPFFR